MTTAARLLVLLAGVLAGIVGPAGRVGAEVVPRTILSLHDGSISEARFSPGHILAETTLNHLGLEVRHIDVRDGLPDPATLGHVRGVLAWRETDANADLEGYVAWMERLAADGKRIVLMGLGAADYDPKGNLQPRDLRVRLYRLVGVRPMDDYVSITYRARVLRKDPSMLDFERPLTQDLAPFAVYRSIDPENTVHLRLGVGEDQESDVVVSGPRGGFVADDYAVYRGEGGDRREWKIDPLRFFSRAFDTDGLPKPDAATLVGRRIYYSHIDGDGWNNQTEINEYKRTRTLAARVILEHVIAPLPDLPVTVAPIVGDLTADMYGTEDSRAVAREIFALPQVEAGSHTHSHPFAWHFFEHYDRDQELSFVKPGSRLARRLEKIYNVPLVDREVEDGVGAEGGAGAEGGGLENGYSRPRAYLDTPFDLHQEIAGSVEALAPFLPPGKKVEVLQWSGDTTPFEGAILAADAIDLPNINGGDTRFDREYPSYGFVAPVGRRVGETIQIYASNSNENTYTDLWTDRYFGFRNLIRTLENTEHPVRFKPLNIYYHMYSGQKLSSLNALLENLAYARRQVLAPVTTSHFARIARGVFTTRFDRLGADRWRVLDRGALQTIRFDRALFRAVDFAASVGVVGQTHYQGSLYVALDPAVAEPVIALTGHDHPDRPPVATVPYLIDARWPVHDVRRDGDREVAFSTSGFGAGAMRWAVPGTGDWTLRVEGPDGALTTATLTPEADGTVRFHAGDGTTLDPVRVILRAASRQEASR